MAKKNRDWYPENRQDQLNLSKKWLSVFTEAAQGKTGKKKYQAWAVPEENFTAFRAAYNEAAAAFEAVLLSGTRGGPLGAAATEKLSALEKINRDLRRRFMYSPPIPPEDMAALEHRQKDATRSAPEKPSRSVAVTVSYSELHAVTLGLLPGPGGQDVSGFTFNIRAGILVPDGKIPERSGNAALYISKVPLIPEDLPGQYSRSRRRETFTYSALEAGMTVYFAIAYQNRKGETGPWMMISAIIT